MENIARHDQLSIQKGKGVEMKLAHYFIALVFLFIGCKKNNVQIRSLREIDFGEYSIPVGDFAHRSGLGEAARYYLDTFGKERDKVLAGFVSTNRLRDIRIIVDIAGGMSAVWRTIIVSEKKMFLLAFERDKLEREKAMPLDEESRIAIENVSKALVSSRGGFLNNTRICDRSVFFVTVYSDQGPAMPFVVDGFVDYSWLSRKVVSNDQKGYVVRPIPEQEKAAFNLLFNKIIIRIL